MCEPTAVIIASAALTAGGAVMSHAAQNRASSRNTAMANRAAQADLNALAIRGMQEREGAMGSLLDVERQVQQARATAAVSAGEAGVSGASVQALLSLVDAEGSDASININRNYEATANQLEREAAGVRITRESRIAAVPRASRLETGLRIAGAGLDAYTTIRGNRPIRGGGG